MEGRINILTQVGYWARYQEIYDDCTSDKEAWQRLEKELDDRFGTGRYSSYESFRTSKSRYYATRRRASSIIR